MFTLSKAVYSTSSLYCVRFKLRALAMEMKLPSSRNSQAPGRDDTLWSWKPRWWYLRGAECMCTWEAVWAELRKVQRWNQCELSWESFLTWHCCRKWAKLRKEILVGGGKLFCIAVEHVGLLCEWWGTTKIFKEGVAWWCGFILNINPTTIWITDWRKARVEIGQMTTSHGVYTKGKLLSCEKLIEDLFIEQCAWS